MNFARGAPHLDQGLETIEAEGVARRAHRLGNPVTEHAQQITPPERLRATRHLDVRPEPQWEGARTEADHSALGAAQQWVWMAGTDVVEAATRQIE